MRLLTFATLAHEAQRHEQLGAKWEIERVLEAGSSTLTLTGNVLAQGMARRFLLLALGVQLFVMQHVV